MTVLQVAPATDQAGGTATITFSNPLTPGSVIFIHTHAFDNSDNGIGTPTDTAGNTYISVITGGADANPAGTAGFRGNAWYAINSSSQALNQISITGADFWATQAVELGDIDTSNPLDVASVVNTGTNSTSGTRTLTGSSITPTTDGATLISAIGGHINAITDPTNITEPTEGGTWTSIGESLNFNATNWGAAAYLEWETTDGTITPSWQVTHSGTDAYNYYVITAAFRPAAAFDLEQEGFRFRNDDGDEDGATWKDAQDTDVSVPLDETFRIRFVIDTSGDPPSAQYQLEWSEAGADDWRAVGVGEPGTTTPTIVGSGAAALTTNDPSVNLSTGGWTPAEGDIVYFFISSTTTLAVAGAAGWANPLGGTTAVNTDAHGSCAAYHVVTAGEAGGSTTFTASNYLSAAETGNVVAVAIRGCDPTNPVLAAQSALNSGNTVTPGVLSALSGGNQPTQTGGLIVRAISQDSTATYTTPGGHTERVTFNTNNGVWLGTRDTATTAGVDVAAQNITPDSGDEYASITVAFRPAPAAPRVNFSTSTNYADGDATTAQLTAPAGAPTFSAGVMVEGAALSDAVDIADSNYTEIEWAVVLEDPAVLTDAFDLRVTRNGISFDTYSQTPTVTAGTAGITVAGATGALEVIGVSGAVALGGTTVDGAVGVVEFIGVAGVVGAAPISITGAVGILEIVAISGTVEFGELDVDGAVGVLELVGVSGAVAQGTLFAWPTAISANSRYIEDQNGNPWFGVGDTCWSLCVQPTAAEATTYLENRAAKGVNLILASIIEHEFSSQTPADENVNGDRPFTGTAFQSTLNDAYWDHIEFITSEAMRLGITIMWCPAYLGFSGTEEGWDTEIVAASNAQMTTYGQALAARFASYPNIIWLIGHDKTPSATEEAREAALSDALQAGTSHLVTVGGVEQLGSDAWEGSGVDYDFDTVYFRNDNEGALHTQAGWNASPTMPTGFLEGRYENDGISNAALRGLMYGPLCSGATYAIFGNNPIWSGGADGAGWSDAEDEFESTGSLNLATFADLVADLDSSWADMTPDVGDTFLTSGEGTGATRAAARFDGTTTTGVLAISYRPSGGSATLQFDLTELNQVANVLVRKFDPTNGNYTDVGTFPTSGTQSIGSLGNNAAGQSDWLLVFEASDIVVIDGSVGVFELVGVSGVVALGELDVTGHVGVVEAVGVAGTVALGELDVTGTVGVYEVTGAAGAVALGELGITGGVGLIDLIGLAGTVAVGELEVTGAVGVLEVVGVSGVVEAGGVFVLGSVAVVEFVGQAGTIEPGELTVTGAVGLIEWVGVAGDVDNGTASAFNLCLDVGAPVFVTRIAGATTFRSRSTGAVEFVARSVGGAEFVDRDVGDPAFVARSTEAVFVEREPGSPVTRDRTTTITFAHGDPDEPTLVCE